MLPVADDDPDSHLRPAIGERIGLVLPDYLTRCLDLATFDGQHEGEGLSHGQTTPTPHTHAAAGQVNYLVSFQENAIIAL